MTHTKVVNPNNDSNKSVERICSQSLLISWNIHKTHQFRLSFPFKSYNKLFSLPASILSPEHQQYRFSMSYYINKRGGKWKFLYLINMFLLLTSSQPYNFPFQSSENPFNVKLFIQTYVKCFAKLLPIRSNSKWPPHYSAYAFLGEQTIHSFDFGFVILTSGSKTYDKLNMQMTKEV